MTAPSSPSSGVPGDQRWSLEDLALLDEGERFSLSKIVPNASTVDAIAYGVFRRLVEGRHEVADLRRQLGERTRERDDLAQNVCDFQAATMLERQGDPSTITPKDLEADIIRMRKVDDDRVDAATAILRGELRSLSESVMGAVPAIEGFHPAFDGAQIGLYVRLHFDKLRARCAELERERDLLRLNVKGARAGLEIAMSWVQAGEIGVPVSPWIRHVRVGFDPAEVETVRHALSSLAPPQESPPGEPEREGKS